MSKVHVLVAMEREAESLGLPCSVIGIGAENIRKRIKADDIVINVGYCGAIGLEPGTIVEPSEAVSLKNGARIFIRPKFDFLHVPCYTAEEFVAEPKFEAGAICDMELFKLAKIPCKELYALKIVTFIINSREWTVAISRKLRNSCPPTGITMITRVYHSSSPPSSLSSSRKSNRLI